MSLVGSRIPKDGFEGIPAHDNPYELLVYGDAVDSYLESESSGSLSKRRLSSNGKNKSVSRNKLAVRVKHVREESSDSQDLYTADGKLANKDIVNKYLKQVKESKGFNIIDYPGPIPGVTTIVPRHDVIDNRNKCPGDYDKIMDMAALAIESYNKKHEANFKVANIKNLNVLVCDGETNYITFNAVNVEGKHGSGLFNQFRVIMTTFLYLSLLLATFCFGRTERLMAKLKKLKSYLGCPQWDAKLGAKLMWSLFDSFTLATTMKAIVALLLESQSADS